MTCFAEILCFLLLSNIIPFAVKKFVSLPPNIQIHYYDIIHYGYHLHT